MKKAYRAVVDTYEVKFKGLTIGRQGCFMPRSTLLRELSRAVPIL